MSDPTESPTRIRRSGNRRPVRLYTIIGVCMALVAAGGYTLVEESRSAAGSHQPTGVATAAAPAADAPIQQLSATGADLIPGEYAARPLTSTELTVLQAEMGAFDAAIASLDGTPPPAPQTTDAALQATLDTMMLALHTMMAQVDEPLPAPPTTQPLLPSVGHGG